MYTIPFLLVLLLHFFIIIIIVYGIVRFSPYFLFLFDRHFVLFNSHFFLSSVLRVSFTFTFLVGIEMTHNMCTIFHKIQRAHTHTHEALNQFKSFSKYLQILANSHWKLWTRWCLAIELDFVLWWDDCLLIAETMKMTRK